MYASMHVHVHACVRACVYARMCVCMRACMPCLSSHLAAQLLDLACQPADLESLLDCKRLSSIHLPHIRTHKLKPKAEDDSIEITQLSKHLRMSVCVCVCACTHA